MSHQIILPHDLEERSSVSYPEPRGSLIDRRHFIKTSALGTAGLILVSTQPVYASPIFGAVGKFAAAIGASVIADLISEYLQRNYVSAAFNEEIGRTNRRMVQLGFNEFDDSTVYGLENSYIMYPVRRGQDGFNTCAAFLDSSRNQGSQRIALIEGPTLLGIGELAAKVRSKRVPAETVRRALLPRSTIESQGVSMQRSYSGPDIYRTDEGNVRAHYTTDGRGKGTVRVEARNERGTLLAGGDYELKYRTAE